MSRQYFNVAGVVPSIFATSLAVISSIVTPHRLSQLGSMDNGKPWRGKPPLPETLPEKHDTQDNCNWSSKPGTARYGKPLFTAEQSACNPAVQVQEFCAFEVLARRGPMQRSRCAFCSVALSAIVFLSGCDDIARELGYTTNTAVVTSQPQTQQTATPDILTAQEIDRYLDGGQMTMVASSNRIISGDLRPLWVLTGRIANSYSRDVKSLRIRITAYGKGTDSATVLDTADFEVNDIPAGAARGFRREIPLMVSPGRFSFSWTILSATVGT
jgi:hypothetical protein